MYRNLTWSLQSIFEWMDLYKSVLQKFTIQNMESFKFNFKFNFRNLFDNKTWYNTQLFIH